MIYPQIYNTSNTTGISSEAGTAYPFGASELTPVIIVGRVAQSLVCNALICIIIVCPFVF
jgi:hypothetical protein